MPLVPIKMNLIKLRYSRKAFFPTLLFLLIAILFLNVFFDLTFLTDPLYISIAAGISFLLVLIIGLSPFLTDHSLDDQQLTLRQGWYFKAGIPLREIKRIEIVDHGPMRTGVFFDILGTALYVTTQRHDLLLVQLNGRKRFSMAWWKRADRVYFDTLDKSIFLKQMAQKGIIPSSQVR